MAYDELSDAKVSPELKFKPELLRTGPRFSSKFSTFVELDLKFSSGLRRFEPDLNQ